MFSKLLIFNIIFLNGPCGARICVCYYAALLIFVPMFIKAVIKTDKKTGKSYKYYRLCESYHLCDKIRHRNILYILYILSLGSLDELTDSNDFKLLADRVEQLLNGQQPLFPIYI